jgi:predicted MFS family arabinose efflux permease
LTAAPPLAGKREQRATRIMFFVIGFAAGAWAPLVPFAKQRLALDDGGLGLLLVCLGAGSIVAMPLAGALAARIGCRRVLVAAAAVACLVFPLLATTSSVPLLAAALLLFGVGIGSLDCVINVQAIVVERGSGRSMMSGFHALYSLGGFAGAGAVSALIGLNVTLPGAALAVATVMALATVVSTPGLLARRAEDHPTPFAVPRGAVLLIGVFCFVMFLAEGSALDWSAVFLRAVRHAAPAEAGLGYVAFAVSMTSGRLVGDRLVAMLGLRRTVSVGAGVAAAGLAIATLAPGWMSTVIGYALVGAGCANIVPALFTAIGRQTVMPESQAVPAVSVLGYAGILAGPAAIGLVASATSLTLALLAVAALLAAVAAGASRLRV